MVEKTLDVIHKIYIDIEQHLNDLLQSKHKFPHKLFILKYMYCNYIKMILNIMHIHHSSFKFVQDGMMGVNLYYKFLKYYINLFNQTKKIIKYFQENNDDLIDKEFIVKLEDCIEVFETQISDIYFPS